ncbi:hypothetical protein CDAR_474641 [Caerostris darwini]|uniref:Uncharacterized protein n=1 Tax=Caerostris darwini TaxID=1538125 RepID=A0AAV4PKW9_9ARAC|nr:hypothetical protein CDAR_474641 [Caerostris darwini]
MEAEHSVCYCFPFAWLDREIGTVMKWAGVCGFVMNTFRWTGCSNRFREPELRGPLKSKRDRYPIAYLIEGLWCMKENVTTGAIKGASFNRKTDTSYTHAIPVRGTG